MDMLPCMLLLHDKLRRRRPWHSQSKYARIAKAMSLSMQPTASTTPPRGRKAASRSGRIRKPPRKVPLPKRLCALFRFLPGFFRLCRPLRHIQQLPQQRHVKPEQVQVLHQAHQLGGHHVGHRRAGDAFHPQRMPHVYADQHHQPLQPLLDQAHHQRRA